MSTPRAGIIIKNKDEYLSVLQDASKLWGFPKGRMKYGEKESDCATRELKEETGIELDINLLKEDNLIHIKRGKHHHFYYIVEVESKPECIIDNDEIADYKWRTLSEFSKITNVSYFTDQVLKKLALINYSNFKKNIWSLNHNKVTEKFQHIYDINTINTINDIISENIVNSNIIVDSLDSVSLVSSNSDEELYELKKSSTLKNSQRKEKCSLMSIVSDNPYNNLIFL